MAIIMKVNPKTIPDAWGSARRAPKLAPVAISIKLLGPGVIEETKQKSTRPVSKE
jgi:hypothetical protein